MVKACPCLCFLLFLAAPAALNAADVMVRASREGDVIHVEASAEFVADGWRVWQVLTDYDHLADFIPDMHTSRVLERRKGTAIVEQKGDFRLLFLNFPIEVTFVVKEFPQELIVSHAVKGSFLEMHNAYNLQVQQKRVRLRYEGHMKPDFLVPPLIGTIALKRSVERQFGALVDEIIQRQQAANRRPASHLRGP